MRGSVDRDELCKIIKGAMEAQPDAQARAQLLYDITRAGYDGIKFGAVSENERLSAGKVSDEALSHQDRVDDWMGNLPA